MHLITKFVLHVNFVNSKVFSSVHVLHTDIPGDRKRSLISILV